jgi:transposase
VIKIFSVKSLSMETVEQMLRNETHPEVLRGIALFISEQAKIIAEENRILRAERDREEAAKQEWLNQEIRKHLNKLKRRHFERGRESVGSLSRDTGEDQLLIHAQSLVGDVKSSEVSNKLPSEEIVYHDSTGEVLASAMKKDLALTAENAEVSEINGFYETSSEITITERTYTRVIHKRVKYRVKNKDTGQETIVAAHGPVKLVPGSRYSIDFALSIVANKYLNHMPYDRQRKDMKRQGVDVPVITMCRLGEQVALHLEGVAEDIGQDIFRASLACHLDETRWPILSKHADDGQMWILSNQAGSYYRFEPTRSGKIADELLKGYSGPVLTDKYSGYLHFRKSADRIWGLCWAHARREFYDLRDDYPEEIKNVLFVIDKLFAIERKAKTWDQLKALRETESLKVLAELKTLIEKYRTDFFDRDDFCKAIHYLLSAWTEFTAFTKEARLPLSNNDAERALRQAVLGRKNFNGSKTIDGADTAATLYTVIESCKKAKLDPVTYMKYVINENFYDRKPLPPLGYAKSKHQKIVNPPAQRS